ncbi:hypothetical protein NUW54_g44 [Trametes sanguinea]|uniref:Uncharacterized protein n=1 Tax=Trametes sanguinea TaxID=158606 RepID=A0ACC1QAA0_9APHY|nr:hypothetical protein NUW54_g44 [Trametes sanguinea]
MPPRTVPPSTPTSTVKVHKGSAKLLSIASAKDTPDKSTQKITAKWSEDDEKALINYLATKGKAAAADGANYRKPVWEAAARHLAKLPCKGAPKTWQVCKNKWSRLKKAYWAVFDLKNNASGMAYDDEKGADITDETEEIWVAYVKSHPDASPFKNKGFVYYASMQPLMPSKAKGSNVFRPGQAEEEPSQVDEEVGEHAGSEAVIEGGEEEQEEEEDDGQDEEGSVDTSPATPVSSQKRKSTLSQSTSVKKVKMSQGALALQAVGEKLDDFNTILRSLVALESQEPAASAPLAPTTPQRKQLAIRRAQELETHLDDNRLVSLINIFQKDGSAADAYLVLERASLRKA